MSLMCAFVSFTVDVSRPNCPSTMLVHLTKILTCSIVQMFSFYMSPVTVLEYKHCREIPTKRPSSYLMEWQWSSYLIIFAVVRQPEDVWKNPGRKLWLCKPITAL